MARSYDPLNAPDPDDWQSMDEDERMMLVMEYHREAGVELPNEQVHAVVHVVVENQIALGDEMSAQATLERLMREGLDRHEAIHAVGSVLVDFVQALRRRATYSRWPSAAGGEGASQGNNPGRSRG